MYGPISWHNFENAALEMIQSLICIKAANRHLKRIYVNMMNLIITIIIINLFYLG